MRAAEADGPEHLADEEGHGDADEDEPGEGVLEGGEGAPVPDEGKGEGGRVRLAERLDDRREQDHEAPEDEGVHDAREWPLQELALAPDHPQLSADPGAAGAPA